MSLLGNKLIETNSDLSDYINILNGTILLLDKNNLEYKYKTNNQLKHIKNDIFIVYDNEKCNSELIDNNGKLKLKLDNCNSIVDIGNNIYLFQSMLMFNDKLVSINNKGKITDLTENRRYRIKKLDNNSIRITLMTGGEYIVDLKIKQCLNVFTQKIEAYTNLFSVVI